MKIAVLVPVWKRPEIFKIMADNLKFPDWIDATVVASVSPDDPDFNENLKIATDHKFFIHVEENFPVGAKMNSAIASMLEMEWDYMLGINSDDILLEEYFEDAREYMDAGHPMIGMREVIAWDCVGHTGGMKMRLGDSHTCKVWGGGRFISRDAIEKTYKKLGYVYTNELNSGLDTSSQRNIFENNIFFQQIIALEKCYLIDLKTEININPYFSLKNVPHEGVDYQYVMERWGDIKKYFE